MATDQGSRPDHLSALQRLESSPQNYHLFHALRVVEAAHPDLPRIGKSRRPRTDAVRLGQEAEMAFPPSTIADFETPENDGPARLTNRFFGLFGPNGPLPLHLTEYARDRLRNHRDPTFIAFANMLTHRMMSLFYRAWVSGQPAPSFDRGNDDPLRSRVASLAGYNGATLADRDEMPDSAKLHFAGHLGGGSRHPEGLCSLLSAFFRAPVQLQEFVGSWLELEKGDRWVLGQPVQLGHSSSIGARVWSRNAKFRLRVGPVPLKDYQRLLPGGASLGRLVAIVRNYVGEALDYDINLVLQSEDIPRAELGRTVRLGHTSWIGDRVGTGDAADLYLQPESTFEQSQSAAAAENSRGDDQ